MSVKIIISKSYLESPNVEEFSGILIHQYKIIYKRIFISLYNIEPQSITFIFSNDIIINEPFFTDFTEINITTALCQESVIF